MVRVATAKHNRERGFSRWFVCMREASGVVAGLEFALEGSADY